ncbi:bifunctional [glutamate--ammonia ligase]-adenylyl-L-tyrosine phosphorylase/[glutamate--ammonia-ligase] adenylyltransferase [Parashewanella tropica]|uniref:bifunctional [glutamate--ammonia ligase]-adenylyl-L-tyrosine phosphorylase/[glutamate--ammonia-ligase] adenylyltransferase n=1 Tax=Parashewanella tropica TaxID=2547970 RepID=UPI001FE33030|nr:bifunctional [glutamate--ammonia ligase]-adenylyl-L-tyrosine phosphorylase/[glutamate--ammonia-ligase] adenylyltransferase [Parashewanella tropica]
MTMDKPTHKPFSQDVQQIALKNMQKLRDSFPDLHQQLNDEQQQQLMQIIGLSDFVSRQFLRHPQWITNVFEELTVDTLSEFYRSRLLRQLETVSNDNEAKHIIRLFRQRQMVTIAWRDFLGFATTEQSLFDLSKLAEATIIATRDWLYQNLCDLYGVPCNAQGEPQPLMIMGMGKLGGGELNFSSDIDLIFAYPEAGETVGGRKPRDNQEFFTRMGQKLIALLDQVTIDGFAYRVDMRLRPYGESGPLVCSYSALEHYYQDQGREWERYAMIKARVLGPFCSQKQELKELLRPFKYRRYIDYTAIESLRKMKRMIAQEVRRRQLDNNIKLGAGGIREAEFVVQNFQLIHGGRQADLRKQNILLALDNIFHHGYIGFNDKVELKKGYLYLRRVENLLQAIDDQQTQTLPDNELDWQRLTWAMNEPSPQALQQKIHEHMENINQQFQVCVGEDQQEDDSCDWAEQIWHEQDLEVAQHLAQAQGVDANELLEKLFSWRADILKKPIGPKGRDALDKLMGYLISELCQHPKSANAFAAIALVLNRVLGRTTYLELLCENPGARKQLILLCQASPWIGEQLAKFPMLLDELIDPAQLYQITKLEDYQHELRQYCLRIPEDDLELQMETLRQFKLSHQLRIAAADITGLLDVDAVSEHLTRLAETLIKQVVQYAWHQTEKRHGCPEHLSANQTGFAVVGYGKLGGRELGYGSDLDLVFLHNCQDKASLTNGEKQIESTRFYAKLAQKIIHLFATRTSSGELYEVDMRLRPSGASGLLVSEIERFGEYQHQAKTWEQQALVRARMIDGNDELYEQFERHRQSVLTQPRDQGLLKTEIDAMREKMMAHLLSVTDEQFDLKHSRGGIVDIEFMTQYWVLAYSDQYPRLAKYSDNLRVLKTLIKLDLLSKEDVTRLLEAYQYYRKISHHCALVGLSTKVMLSKEIEQYVKHVTSCYERILKQV